MKADEIVDAEDEFRGAWDGTSDKGAVEIGGTGHFFHSMV
mgnify:CR=1 FL=1